MIFQYKLQPLAKWEDHAAAMGLRTEPKTESGKTGGRHHHATQPVPRGVQQVDPSATAVPTRAARREPDKRPRVQVAGLRLKAFSWTNGWGASVFFASRRWFSRHRAEKRHWTHCLASCLGSDTLFNHVVIRCLEMSGRLFH